MPVAALKFSNLSKMKLFISRNPRESCTIGRAEIDLTSLRSDHTNQISLTLRGDETFQSVCELNLVIWVTGINGAANTGEPEVQQRKENIGNLTVRVVQASGLGSSRLQGAKFSFDDQNEIKHFRQDPPTLSVSSSVKISSSGPTQKLKIQIHTGTEHSVFQSGMPSVF